MMTIAMNQFYTTWTHSIRTPIQETTAITGQSQQRLTMALNHFTLNSQNKIEGSYNHGQEKNNKSIDDSGHSETSFSNTGKCSF
jgi:hypothetical protein